MTQEEKRTLLVDLCARLPYGVICSCIDNNFTPQSMDYELVSVNLQNETVIVCYNDWNNDFNIEYVKPYLRPLSSMTEEEALKLWDLLYSSYRRNKILEIIIKQERIDYILDKGVASTETFPIYYDDVVRTIDTFDWLNAHHFDYRSLIENGLALEAHEGMYVIK